MRIHLSYGSASIYTESVCEHETGVVYDKNFLLACAAWVKFAEMMLRWSSDEKDFANGCAF